MPTATNSCKEYPVSPQGDQLHGQTWDCSWRPNVPFSAQMTLLGTSRVGGSSANFHWESADGRQWVMFVADLTELIKLGTLDRGQITGWWRVRKRGRNYGLVYLGETYEVVA